MNITSYRIHGEPTGKASATYLDVAAVLRIIASGSAMSMEDARL